MYSHIPKSHFTEQQQTDVVPLVGAAVVGRLGHHVREVDALAEHVARHRGFRRGDP